MIETRRLLMLPVGDARTASSRYRALAHVPALEAAGFRTRVRYPVRSERAWPAPRPLLRLYDLLRDATERSAPDLLFIQRKTYPPFFASRLGRLARRVVFDLDDAVDLPPSERAASARESARYRRNFEATLGQADLVLCGNRELARRLPHDRFVLLPTAIDTSRFDPRNVGPARPGTLGWVGHSSNLEYLEALAAPLKEVMARHPGTRLVVVCDRPPRLPGLEVEFRPWSLEREVSCFEGIAIGLMPLADSRWARCKCAFKAIQYMSLAIPAVISPVGMNTEVVRDGETGFLPADPAQWVQALDRLLSDPSLAARVGAAGREAVLRDYSLTAVSRTLVETLEAVLASPRVRS